MPIQYCVLFSAIYDIYDATNITFGAIVELHIELNVANNVMQIRIIISL